MSTGEAPLRPHLPVLLDAVLAAASPVRGVWIDGTFGAGGYARALIEAGAARVLGIDRDPEAGRLARPWLAGWPGIALQQGRFGDLDSLAGMAGSAAADGVVLDIGVSSMQLDRAERGFSFMRDGPLDMRMAQDGPSAADLVNALSETDLASLIHKLGEERAARRIARAIAVARARMRIERTRTLAEIVERCMPAQRPGQAHPATRTFQALRIAVNDELDELVRGLAAAERVLAPGGLLAVVTFHSLEDRIVKRYIAQAAGEAGGNSRHAPETAQPAPRFEKVTRKAVKPGAAEIAANPRARSARLRVARRLDAPPLALDPAQIDLGLGRGLGRERTASHPWSGKGPRGPTRKGRR
ncbi:MAG: 16S rRNA (cytosine(1402)-N(4))-methyltransferase RsmH [Pseudomonadota bacterium]